VKSASGHTVLSWPTPRSFPQEKILENEFPFAAGKRRSAGQTSQRAVNRFETSLDLVELIKRFAVKTCKENERT
jgi:hypothetical protein